MLGQRKDGTNDKVIRKGGTTMTNFECALAVIYYFFAWGYMAHTFGIDKCDSIVIRLLIVIASMTIGILYFPAIFAEDIWKKLNKEEQL